MQAKVEVQAKTGTRAQSKATSRASMMTSAKLPNTPCLNDCSNAGVCLNGVCMCDPGKEGNDCSVVSSCPDNCSGHGICTRGQCWCDPAWTDANCSLKAPSGRQFPQPWVTAILCSLTFFIGIIVGRKTLASQALKNILEAETVVR
jgi:hypothetical protein